MAQLPVVGASFNTWGSELNTYLLEEHQFGGDHYPRVQLRGVAYGGSVTNGDAVFFDSSTNTLQKAIADGSYRQEVIGMMRDIDNTAIVIFGITDTTSPVIAGTQYYLSDTTAGKIVPYAPSNAVKIGIGVPSDIGTALLVNIR